MQRKQFRLAASANVNQSKKWAGRRFVKGLYQVLFSFRLARRNVNYIKPDLRLTSPQFSPLHHCILEFLSFFFSWPSKSFRTASCKAPRRRKVNGFVNSASSITLMHIATRDGSGARAGDKRTNHYYVLCTRRLLFFCFRK